MARDKYSAALGMKRCWWVLIRCKLTQLEAPEYQQRAPRSAPRGLHVMRFEDHTKTSHVCQPTMADQTPDPAAEPACSVYQIFLKQKLPCLGLMEKCLPEKSTIMARKISSACCGDPAKSNMVGR